MTAKSHTYGVLVWDHEDECWAADLEEKCHGMGRAKARRTLKKMQEVYGEESLLLYRETEQTVKGMFA